MLRKIAKVVNKQYVEIVEDEGPAHPATQEEKSREFQSELLPVSMGRTLTTTFIKPHGMKLC